MSAVATQDQLRLGFLTAVEDADGGIVGGLLVTNRFGRPLEFQCTTPVRPNRTQQILYGPTLRPYLLTEVIGRTLLEKVGVQPHLVLTESPELLDLRLHVPMPVASLVAADADPADGVVMVLGQQRLRFHADFPQDGRDIERRKDQVPETADLKEPFERIREALSETLKMPVAKAG
ncbi:MAG: hypothetical protein SH850_28305 [Planctomycetaceae bacterium]|nr:hypothetical protein [Planctomycetaceae bacterium]